MGQQLSIIFRCQWVSLSTGQALSNIVQWLWTSMGRTPYKIFRALFKIFRCLWGADDEEKRSQSQHLLPLSRPDSSSWKRKSKPEGIGCILIPPPSAIHYICPSLPGSDSVSEPSPHCTMLIPPPSPDLPVALSGTQSLLDQDLLNTGDGLQQDILVSLLRLENDNADDKEKRCQSQHLLPLSRPDSSSWKRKSKPQGSGCILIPPPYAVHRHVSSTDAIHYQCPSLPGSDSVSEPSPHCNVASISGTQSLLDQDLLKPGDGLQKDILVSLLRVENDNLLSYDTNEVFSKTIEVVEQSKPVVSSPSKVKLKVPLKQKIGKGITTEERWINHYSSGQKILLVGEGDFSFSASLAMAFGTATNMTATSLDSKAFLKKNYMKAMSNVKTLKKRGCSLIHGVDATKMANHLLLSGMTFDCVIFNFPHAGFQRHESRKSQLRRHRELVNGFLGNAKGMIDEKGKIHITHKSNGFFLAWDLQRLASNHGLSLIEKVQFDVADYPGYGTKYGFGGDKCFNCNPSKTYKFGL